MALSIASLATATWTSSGTKTLTFSAVSAGSVLVVIGSSAGGSDTWANPTSGWTAGPKTDGTRDFTSVTYWRIADGSETSFSIDAPAGAGNLVGAKITGFAGTATLEDSSEIESHITGSAVTSIGPISGSNSFADAAVLVLYGSDRFDTIDDGQSYTGSFAEVERNSVGGSRVGAWIAGKVVSSAGTQSTTFSCVDTGDQIYAAMLVFGDDTGGSVESGAGSAAGSATVTGAGAAIAAGTGTADGTSTAPGVGASTAAGTGTASGTSTASGVGSTGGSVEEGAGTASGTSTATGAGASIAAGEGDADGSSQASGAGAATAAGTGSAAGSSEATGVSGDATDIQEGTGSASGSSEAAGAGASIAAGAGSSTGSSVASGVSVDSRALIGTVTTTPTLLATVISIGKYTGSVLSAPAFTHSGITSEAA